MNTAPVKMDRAIEAWRAWLLTIDEGEPRLRSVVRADIWTPRAAFIATCPAGDGSEAIPRHDPPSAFCECGVHAAKARGRAADHLAPPSRRGWIAAVGTVDLWGTVIEGEHGWRASFAYPTWVELVTWRTDPQALDDLEWARRSIVNAYDVAVSVSAAVPGRAPASAGITSPGQPTDARHAVARNGGTRDPR